MKILVVWSWYIYHHDCAHGPPRHLSIFGKARFGVTALSSSHSGSVFRSESVLYEAASPEALSLSDPGSCRNQTIRQVIVYVVAVIYPTPSY